MEKLRELLKQQHDMDELTSEVQRKEIIPTRAIHLLKIVRHNVEIAERVVSVLKRTQGVVGET